MEEIATEVPYNNIVLDKGESCIVFREDGSEDMIRKDLRADDRATFVLWAINNPLIWKWFRMAKGLDRN